ncbi:Thioesterase/thiol ester dehydrase-isomerase [Crepidotus variabilis]|uniref:Thioesterase/thiol ester dehydrase-isomerase n=1 Tax=Crepidotus variabilis TaxID=179855 RepID=A0A9P6EHT0_9AGAR|nr:Thioesterase/thiol ester dehydrase-isomerase [Crepidotus variabilis]
MNPSKGMLRLTSPRLFRTSYHAARKNSTISALQAAFRDPSSPYYLAPGERGPEDPNSPPVESVLNKAASEAMETLVDPLRAAEARLEKRGFDPKSFWEQRIVWGDHDSFQHVNNVRYVRFFESARIKWMMSVGEILGGPQRARDMLDGRGISLILKSIEVQFRRPVTFPDTLLIGYKVLPTPEGHTDLATFFVKASAYSLDQKAFVAHSKEALVWYDYDKLKKTDPGEDAMKLLLTKTHKE